jgi:alkanesulfonate monooxygenase SsuD/methylene tetrahydromethanopterin reductase-like flavin-dependent oxidoreductase (luciferase family)
VTDERQMALRGDGRNVNRYRVSKDDDSLVSLYLDVRGAHTVRELLDAIAEAGATPEDVTFRGGCFVITVPSTAEDRAAWKQYDIDRAERARTSRREQYERLRAEFEEGPDER